MKKRIIAWVLSLMLLMGLVPTVTAVEDRLDPSNGTVALDQILDRGTACYVLWMRCGCPEPLTTEMVFPDVPVDHVYFNPIMWAVEQGIADGSFNIAFEPDQVCTRAQMVTYLYRMHGSPLIGDVKNPFVDVGMDSVYFAPVLWGLENNIMTGVDKTHFAPEESCVYDDIYWDYDAPSLDELPEGDTTPVPGDDIVAAGTYEYGLTWVLTTDGTLTVYGEGDMIGDDYSTEAPWDQYAEQITTVVISPGVKSVKDFDGCYNLRTVSLPEGMTYINGGAFSDCTSLEEVLLPESLEAIYAGAFSNCDSLTHIKIPAGVTLIDTDTLNSPFSDCDNLTAIEVDPGNTHYCSVDGVLMSKDQTFLIQVPGAFEGEYIVPDTVTRLLYGAFQNCHKLTEVTIPEGVTDRTPSFLGCTSLKTVNLPNDIEIITNAAFYWCSGLESIIIPDSVTTIYRDAFFECASLKSITIPDSVTELAMEVFYGCESLEEAVIGSGVTEISACLFQNCSALSSVQLPETITAIGEQAFADCASLRNIELPDTVTVIDSHAFFSSGLEQITIPASVQRMGGHSLYSCDNLTAIFFKGDAPEVYNDWCGSSKIISNFYCVPTAYYPIGNETWTDAVRNAMSSDAIWKAYNPNNPFTDVPVGSFYEVPVEWALEKGITTGASEDSFNPDGQCLRAQVVTFLHRAAQNPEPASTKNPFTDVKTTDFFYKPVLWAVEQGITNGVSADKFGSYDVCNRAAVVTFLWRAAGSPEPTSTNNPFSDVKTTDFFYKPVLWAVENGITNGLSATEFGPTAPCNRAQVVTFLYRAYN